MMSLSGSLRSHDGPTPPEELPPLDEELLLEELLEVPELPLEDVPLEPELDDVEPVSGFAESTTPLSSGALSVFGGSFVLLSGGVGSAVFASWTSAPRPSSGDVAQAEMRATSDRTATGMRAKRRMGRT